MYGRTLRHYEPALPRASLLPREAHTPAPRPQACCWVMPSIRGGALVAGGSCPHEPTSKPPCCREQSREGNCSVVGRGGVRSGASQRLAMQSACRSAAKRLGAQAVRQPAAQGLGAAEEAFVDGCVSLAAPSSRSQGFRYPAPIVHDVLRLWSLRAWGESRILLEGVIRRLSGRPPQRRTPCRHPKGKPDGMDAAHGWIRMDRRRLRLRDWTMS